MTKEIDDLITVASDNRFSDEYVGSVSRGHLAAIKAMAEENKRLRAALSFYAEEPLYDYARGAMSCNPQLILQDRGKKARAAIKGE